MGGFQDNAVLDDAGITWLVRRCYAAAKDAWMLCVVAMQLLRYSGYFIVHCYADPREL